MLPNQAGQWPAHSPTAPAGSRDSQSGGVSPRVAAREFSRLFAAHGITTHPAEVRRIAGKFCDAGHDLSRVEDFVLAYSDPTGESAWRLADRDKGLGERLRRVEAARTGGVHA